MGSSEEHDSNLLAFLVLDESVSLVYEEHQHTFEKMEDARDGLHVYQLLGQLLQEVARQGRKFHR